MFPLIWKHALSCCLTGLQRLDQLAQMESRAGAQGGAAGEGDEAPVEDAIVDTDEEEDMENDDYYQVWGWGTCAWEEASAFSLPGRLRRIIP